MFHGSRSFLSNTIISFFALFVGATIATTPASADKPTWAGAYVGVFGAWTDFTSKSIDLTGEEFGGGTPGAAESASGHGAIFGGHAGYRFQSGNWVFGPEIEIGHISGDNLSVVNGDDGVLVKYDGVYATFTGTIGYAHENLLFFAKGGVALSKITNLGGEYDGPGSNPDNYDFDDNEAGVGDKTRVGFVVGGGVEYAFDANWALKAEYSYIKFGNETYDTLDNTNDPFRFEDSLHAVKFGLSYRF